MRFWFTRRLGFMDWPSFELRVGKLFILNEWRSVWVFPTYVRGETHHCIYIGPMIFAWEHI